MAQVEHKRITLGQGMLPSGVELGIQTMRGEEVALIAVQPAKAFGSKGDASRGVPPNAVVEYQVTLLKILEMTVLSKGKLTKYRLERGTGWEKPADDAEVLQCSRVHLLACSV